MTREHRKRRSFMALLGATFSAACHSEATPADALDAALADGASATDGAPDSDGASTSDGASADAPGPFTSLFVDDFDAFDSGIWSCEFSCPIVTGGVARFSLQAGVPPDREGSWSKAVYTPRRFTSGRFTARFALTARPDRAVWWGAALWDTGPQPDESQFNEINFGYTTDESFTNAQLYFESARLGNGVSIKIDTGVDLYDGAFHTATLEFDATHVSLYFDGVLMHTITDPGVIPTGPMDFILGPRLVTNSAPLDAEFIESVDRTEIAW
jgi:beta-glucanase (GH16 family)